VPNYFELVVFADFVFLFTINVTPPYFSFSEYSHGLSAMFTFLHLNIIIQTYDISMH